MYRKQRLLSLEGHIIYYHWNLFLSSVLISHQNKFKSMLVSLPNIQNAKYMLKISAVKQFNRIDRERERICKCVFVCVLERETEKTEVVDRTS